MTRADLIEPTDPSETGDASEATEESTDQLASEPARARRSFRVGSNDRVIGGVAGSLAAALGLNASWVRLFFVVLALVGGVGVLVYFGLWLTMFGRDHDQLLGRVAGGFLLLVVLPWYLVGAGVVPASGPFAVIALLVGVALLLWQPPHPAAMTSGRDTVDTVDTVDAGTTNPAPGHVNDFRSAQAVRADRAPANRGARGQLRIAPKSKLGRITMGLAFSVAAVGALIDANNGGRLHPEQWLGAAAVTCGLGLLVGSVRGYARWLIVPAVGFGVLGVVSGQMAQVGVPLTNTFGDRYVRVEANSPRTHYRLERGYASGHVMIESDVARDVVVDATLLAGTLTVGVPEGVRVELNGSTPDGTTLIFSPLTGTESGSITTFGPKKGPTVRINAHVERGNIDVISWKPWVPSQTPIEPVPEIWDVDLVEINDQFSVSSNGYIVINDGVIVDGPGYGEEAPIYEGDTGGIAVINPANEVIRAPYRATREGAITMIEMGNGTYQLLDDGTLIDPNSQVWELDALRALRPTVSSPSSVTPAG